MRWFVLVAFALVVVGIRTALVGIDDSALKNAVLYIPTLGAGRGAVSAGYIALRVRGALQDAHCELLPNGLEVDVQQSSIASLKLQGAGMQVRSGRGPTQAVDISVRCLRKGAFFGRSALAFTLHTAAPGNGSANHYPPRTPEDSNPVSLEADGGTP
jgi:hypothetical protein